MNNKKRSYVILAVLLFVIGSSFGLWRTDWFQEHVFPETYWRQKVNELKGSVSGGEWMISHTVFEIEKKRRTAELDVAQKVELSRRIGMDLDRAGKEAAEEIAKEIDGLTQLLRIMHEGLKKDREKLAVAQQQFARYAK
jgi:hypothetical protein